MIKYVLESEINKFLNENNIKVINERKNKINIGNTLQQFTGFIGNQKSPNLKITQKYEDNPLRLKVSFNMVQNNQEKGVFFTKYFNIHKTNENDNTYDINEDELKNYKNEFTSLFNYFSNVIIPNINSINWNSDIFYVKKKEYGEETVTNYQILGKSNKESSPDDVLIQSDILDPEDANKEIQALKNYFINKITDLVLYSENNFKNDYFNIQIDKQNFENTINYIVKFKYKDSSEFYIIEYNNKNISDIRKDLENKYNYFLSLFEYIKNNINKFSEYKDKIFNVGVTNSGFEIIGFKPRFDSTENIIKLYSKIVRKDDAETKVKTILKILEEFKQSIINEHKVSSGEITKRDDDNTTIFKNDKPWLENINPEKIDECVLNLQNFLQEAKAKNFKDLFKIENKDIYYNEKLLCSLNDNGDIKDCYKKIGDYFKTNKEDFLSDEPVTSRGIYPLVIKNIILKCKLSNYSNEYSSRNNNKTSEENSDKIDETNLNKVLDNLKDLFDKLNNMWNTCKDPSEFTIKAEGYENRRVPLNFIKVGDEKNHLEKRVFVPITGTSQDISGSSAIATEKSGISYVFNYFKWTPWEEIENKKLTLFFDRDGLKKLFETRYKELEKEPHISSFDLELPKDWHKNFINNYKKYVNNSPQDIKQSVEEENKV